MSVTRLGLNGFGRIGRAVFRHVLSRPDLEVVAINDLGNNAANLCYMLKYDSAYGTLPNSLEVRQRASEDKYWTVDEIVVDGQSVKAFSEEKIEVVPWNQIDVDVVIDATGSARNLTHARELIGPSVKKVVVTNSPDRLVDCTLALGVNESAYNPATHHVVAASICDAVGLAPVIAKINRRYGIRRGFVTTLHPWLGYQNLLDGKPSISEFKERLDLYDPSTHAVMGRSSVGTLIPKSTSAVSAIEKLLPEIRGKLSGMSFRVPTDVVACGVVNLEISEPATLNGVREYLRSCVDEPYFAVTDESLISVDYKGNSNSCVLDAKWLEVVDSTLLRFVCWYDNEWGYSARVVDVARYLHQCEVRQQ